MDLCLLLANTALAHSSLEEIIVRFLEILVGGFAEKFHCDSGSVFGELSCNNDIPSMDPPVSLKRFSIFLQNISFGNWNFCPLHKIFDLVFSRINAFFLELLHIFYITGWHWLVTICNIHKNELLLYLWETKILF